MNKLLSTARPLLLLLFCAAMTGSLAAQCLIQYTLEGHNSPNGTGVINCPGSKSTKVRVKVTIVNGYVASGSGVFSVASAKGLFGVWEFHGLSPAVRSIAGRGVSLTLAEVGGKRIDCWDFTIMKSKE